MDVSVIKTESLIKEFSSGLTGKKIWALRGLDLEIRKGEIFGFLGPNGAGKTTTMKILVGLITPTAGEAWVMGRPVSEVNHKREIGFLPEAPYFYEYLTAREFLHFYGELCGIKRNHLKKKSDELLERVGLKDEHDRPLRKFSKGMLQRIGIAQALINDPQLIILDEPMSGLDPLGRREVRDLILSLRRQGKTVFFSTHIIPDVEMICDRIGILVQGRLVALGRVEELLSSCEVRSVEVVAEGVGEEAVGLFRNIASDVIIRGKRVLLILEKEACVDTVVDIVKSSGGRLISLTPQKETLEDLFVTKVEERLR